MWKRVRWTETLSRGVQPTLPGFDDVERASKVM